MKLLHDIENDLEHTIPPEGGWDSRLLFRRMTERSIALLDVRSGATVLDLACGMGQDTLAIAGAVSSGAIGANGNGVGYVLGAEPSHRMIRFAHMQWRERTAAGSTTGPAAFCRALGEELPFRNGSFEAVLCKGSLDHFMELGLALREIARVLKPGGIAVIALANYDSLSCVMGRWWDGLKRRVVPGFSPPPFPFYEPPPDHMTRFGYREIATLARPHLHPARLEGISLLWGFPAWSGLLGVAPPFLRGALLGGAFALGRAFPRWADVIVLQAVKAT